MEISNSESLKEMFQKNCRHLEGATGMNEMSGTFQVPSKPCRTGHETSKTLHNLSNTPKNLPNTRRIMESSSNLPKIILYLQKLRKYLHKPPHLEPSKTLHQLMCLVNPAQQELKPFQKILTDPSSTSFHNYFRAGVSGLPQPTAEHLWAETAAGDRCWGKKKRC